MLPSDQEILIEMIDHIKDKDTKSKFIRKIMDKNNKNTLPLSNTYKFKDVIKQFEIQNPVTIQDLQYEIKQIKMQIDDLKIFTRSIDSKLHNMENQRISLNNQNFEEVDNFVNSMTIVEKQRWYKKITLKIDPGYQ